MRGVLETVSIIVGLTVTTSTAGSRHEADDAEAVRERRRKRRDPPRAGRPQRRGLHRVFSHRLTNRVRQLSKPAGSEVGTTSGVCQVLRVDQRRLCRWQFDLSNGTLVLAGIVRVNQWSPLAIIGGSGAYANVHGDATRTAFPGTASTRSSGRARKGGACLVVAGRGMTRRTHLGDADRVQKRARTTRGARKWCEDAIRHVDFPVTSATLDTSVGAVELDVRRTRAFAGRPGARGLASTPPRRSRG